MPLWNSQQHGIALRFRVILIPGDTPHLVPGAYVWSLASYYFNGPFLFPAELRGTRSSVGIVLNWTRHMFDLKVCTLGATTRIYSMIYEPRISFLYCFYRKLSLCYVRVRG